MKKGSLRYTEYKIDMSPNDVGGWIKLILIHTLIGPVRLINEISRKVLFLGQKVILKLIVCALAINVGFILWTTILIIFGVGMSNFISFPVLLVSIIFLFVLYLKMTKLDDFKYNTIEENINEEIIELNKEENEENDNFFLPIEEKVFEDVTTAPVSFNDSINIFIKNPEELDLLKISPAAYQEAEEARLLNAIEKKFSINPIVVPDIFEEVSEIPQLDDKFSELMTDLENQIKSI